MLQTHDPPSLANDGWGNKAKYAPEIFNEAGKVSGSGQCSHDECTSEAACIAEAEADFVNDFLAALAGPVVAKGPGPRGEVEVRLAFTIKAAAEHTGQASNEEFVQARFDEAEQGNGNAPTLLTLT